MVIKNYVIKPPEDTIKSENDLKPCPFCGGEAELTGRYIKGGANNYQYFIRCKRCKARPQAYNTFRKSERAIEEWNRREPEEEREKEISTALCTWLSLCFFAAIMLSRLKLRQAFWGICLAESLVIPCLLIGYFLDKRRKRKKMILFVAGIPPKYNPESKAIKKVGIENRRENMTNFEKYKDEILALTGQGKKFSIRNNKICSCDSTLCGGCRFGNYKESCEICRIKWLCEEAKPTLTAKERGFCEIIDSGYIARDKNGTLTFYELPPQKSSSSDDWFSPDYCFLIVPEYFPFITYEDNEPWSIEDLLNLEVE